MFVYDKTKKHDKNNKCQSENIVILYAGKNEKCLNIFIN